MPQGIGLRPLKIRGTGHYLVALRFTTNGAGAVGTTTNTLGAATVTKPAGTGIYRVTLAKPAQRIVACVPSILKSTAHSFLIQPQVLTASTGIVDLLVTSGTAAAATISAGTAVAVSSVATLANTVSTATLGGYSESTSTVLADLVNSGAFPHKAGTTPTLSISPDATALASAITLGNELATLWQAHDDDVNIHPTADTGGLAVASPAATDQASLNTLLNELKGDWNTHVAKVNGDGAAVEYHTGYGHRDICATSNASDEATSVALANALKKIYNRSVQSKPPSDTLLKSGGSNTQPTITNVITQPTITNTITQPTFTANATALSMAAADLLSCEVQVILIVDDSTVT